MYGKHTNLAIAEYWRWWVVHLWVEGFLKSLLRLLLLFFCKTKFSFNKNRRQSNCTFGNNLLSGGIIGTLHHLYFSGTPMVVLALGSVFSALEVVPLVFVGYEAWENIKLSRATEWVTKYKWAINFLLQLHFGICLAQEFSGL